MNESEKKYFINGEKYNCPFCKTNSIPYYISGRGYFDWNNKKTAYYYRIKCSDCNKQSFHLSWDELPVFGAYPQENFYDKGDFSTKKLDACFFYSVPRSQFSSDNRLPAKIRDLMFEAAGCLHSNFLTGASGCIRKAIYELLVIENLVTKDQKTDDYEKLIKSLKTAYPNVDPGYFDTLFHIQGITSDQLHENSKDNFTPAEIDFLLETLKTVLYEMKIEPLEREERKQRVIKLRSETTKKSSPQETPNEEKK